MIPHDLDTTIAALANGVRIVAIRLPHLDTAAASVFVRTGSAHESARLAGISHFVEHMAFKGTHERSCQQVNLDAERLGAEVNAHTDKDHTAYHMRGLAAHADRFVHMLADIVQNGTFPETELERERGVIRHEYIEDEDDPLSMAFRLFDKTCYGAHPLARPVIGTLRNIERITRADLLGYVGRQYSGANVVVGVAGNVDPDAMCRKAEAAFGSMPPGAANAVDEAAWFGGVRSRRIPGSVQTHVVLGFPIPALAGDDGASIVAAALFGEGMSSPLLDEIRERRGLAYHAGCSADVMSLAGQFVVEATTAPEHVDEFLVEVARLLHARAESIDAGELERARNQIAVRGAGARERPFRLLEDAAQDLFVHGRVRSQGELAARVAAVEAGDVRDAFRRMLRKRPSIAIAGKMKKGGDERVLELFGRATPR